MPFKTLQSLINKLGDLINPATENTQLLVKAKTDNIDVALSTRATEATLAKTVGIALPEYDAVTATYNDGTFTETYVYKLATVTKATITVIFTDATKAKLVSITRT